MLQEQRGDFVEIDHFSHCSPPYRRTEGIRHAVGQEGIPAAERIHINHGEPPKRRAACEQSLLPTKDQRKQEERNDTHAAPLLPERAQSECARSTAAVGPTWVPVHRREITSELGWTI